MKLLNSAYFQRMQQSLDVASLRHQVSANNVANIDTPYFKRSDVVFEELLLQQTNKQSLEGKLTDSRHIPIGGAPVQPTPKVVQDESLFMTNNLNNVDIDAEMALIAKNQLRYNVIVQQMNHEIRNIRTAIQGRG